MTDVLFCEHIREALPGIAEPIRAGEKVAGWMERVARATGISAARLRAYWNYRVSIPRISEYQAVMEAAHKASLRRQAIQDMEHEIAARVAELEAIGRDVAADSPRLVGFLPPVAARSAAAARKAVKS